MEVWKPTKLTKYPKKWGNTCKEVTISEREDNLAAPVLYQKHSFSEIMTPSIFVTPIFFFNSVPSGDLGIGLVSISISIQSNPTFWSEC